MLKVAVIGMGYSGAVVVERLRLSAPDILIDVYDGSISAGAGQAYQRDIFRNLVNRPAELMYLRERGDFQRWLDEYGVRKPGSYQPRSLFGNFIEETLRISIEEHQEINIYNEHVVGLVEHAGEYSVQTNTCLRRGYSVVVLATGNPESVDFYGLRGSSGYLNSPYPTMKLASVRSTNVGVIGNQLSAIDAALGLLGLNSESRVTMLSRKTRIPNYSESYSARPLMVLNEQNIAQKLAGSTTALRAVRDMFDDEFEAQGLNVKFQELMHDYSNVSAAREDIYSLLSSTNLVVPVIWHYLPEREKSIFIRRYQAAWRQLRVPIPRESWEKIHDYMRAGRLACHVGLKEVVVNRSGFIARGRGFELGFSAIINATGAGDPLADPLYQSLTSTGICTRHRHGGVNVRYDDCRVISTQGPSNVFAIGAPTSGVFYSVSNIDVLHMQAGKICSNILASRGRGL